MPVGSSVRVILIRAKTAVIRVLAENPESLH